MNIIATRTKDGMTLGFDDDSGQWVPLDTAMAEGSTVGNIGRAAVEEMSRIGLGIREAGSSDPRIAQERALSDQALQSRQGAAPLAQAVGSVVPDIGAGLVAGALTNGMGVVPMLAGEGLAGASLGAMRPGTAEERVQNAMWGAGLNVAGAAVGLPIARALAGPAERGYVRAMEIYRGIGAKTSETVARGMDNAADLTRQAEAARMMEAQRAAGLTDEAGSVGAAKTPQSALPEDIRMMNQTMSSESASETMVRQAAEAHGWQPPPWFGTARGSKARLYGALDEFNPFKDVRESYRVEANQETMAQAMAHALNLAPSPKNEFTKLMAPDMALAEKMHNEMYQTLRLEIMPDIAAKEFSEAFKGISGKTQLLGDSKADSYLKDVVERARGSRAKVDGEEFMKVRQVLADKAAGFRANVDTASAEVMDQAVEKMDEVMQDHLTRMAERAQSHDARAAALSIKNTYSEMRRRSNLFRMLGSGAGVANDGAINAATVFRAMKKPKRLGGYGYDGPPPESQLRPLFEIVRAEAASGTAVPPTGVRMIGEFARRNVGSIGGGVAGAGLGYGLLNQLD